jgi:mercuric ion transport protein
MDFSLAPVVATGCTILGMSRKGKSMAVNDASQKKPTASARPGSPNWLAALGLITGLGAVVASSCCVIPLGLAALGAGASVVGGLELIAAWRVPLLAASALTIGGGWSAWWMRRSAICASKANCSVERSRSTLALLLCASALTVAAASWSYIDPMLLKLFRER